MKIELNTKEFSDMLQRSKGFLDTSKNTSNLMKCVALTLSKGGVFQVTVTDKAQMYSEKRKANKEWDYTKGRCLVNLVDLLKAVKATKSPTCVLEFVSNGEAYSSTDVTALSGYLKVQVGKFIFKLDTLFYETIKEWLEPKRKVHTTFAVQMEALSQRFTQLSPIMCTSDFRQYLSCIMMVASPNDTGLTLCATDGGMLRVCSMSFTKPVTLEEVLIPRACVHKLLKVFDKSDTVDITISNNSAKFAFGDREVFTLLIDGTFPDYHRVIPDTADATEISINAPELYNGIDTLHKTGSNHVHALATKDNITFVTEGLGMRGKVEVPTGDNAEQADVSFGCSADYLLLALKDCAGDIKILVKDSATPITLVDLNDTAITSVFMPCRSSPELVESMQKL